MPQPDVAVFTKEHPCTKKEIWSAFRKSHGFARITVANAHKVIGVNVPRGLEREGRLVRETVGQVDYYRLTREGAAWLLRGMRRYLSNHPSERSTIPFLAALLEEE